MPRPLPARATLLISVLIGTAAAALAASGCAATSESDRRKEAMAARILDEKTPYGFHRGVSLTLLRTRQAERAVPHIRQLLSIRPDAPEPHWLMARAQLQLGLHDQAREELRRALALDEEFAPAHALTGMLLDKLGQPGPAEKHHRRAIELAPGHAEYHNNLGFNLYVQGRLREAVKVYHQALALSPTLRRVHNNLGFAYARLGDMDAALKHFRLGGREALANNNMGFAHEGRGELELAYNYYLAAARQEPDFDQIRKNLERVCKRLGKPLPELLPSPERKPEDTGSGAPEGKGS